jgi:hypothetical protein
MIAFVLVSGLLGLALVGGLAAWRFFAQARFDPALGERYVDVAGSDLTIRRGRPGHDRGDGDGGACDGDGGD